MNKIKTGDYVCIPATRINDGFDVWGTVTAIDGNTTTVTAQGQPRSVVLSRLRTATQMDRRAAAEQRASAAARYRAAKSERLTADIEAAKKAAIRNLQFAGVESAGDACVVVIHNRITSAVYLGCEGKGGSFVFRVSVGGTEYRVAKLLHQSRLSTAR